jgi:hypothetical protein
MSDKAAAPAASESSAASTTPVPQEKEEEPSAKRPRGANLIEDTLRFSDETALHTAAEYAAAFGRVAEFLLDRCVIHIADVPHRLTEIEVYYRGGAHQDPYPHCDELQRTHARWFVLPFLSCCFEFF